jgi:malate dehydrogenase
MRPFLPKRLVKVAITGAAGQIGYSLLFRLARGDVFGPNCCVQLSLLELPECMKAVEGAVLELEDCGFPLLSGVDIFESANEAFDGVHWALLLGSKTRGPGMERKDLLRDNGPIFVAQGKALTRAATDIQVVTVGNPCNTNALIALHNSKDILASRFSAMTMLDENRAKSFLAKKFGCNVRDINIGIWGNHSSSMYPDFEYGTISGEKITDIIKDRSWLEGDFLKSVQQRGAAIISARGKGSAASAAKACVDHIRRLLEPTPRGEYFSCAVPSDGNSYDVPAGLIFSFPVRSFGDGNYEIVENIPVSEYGKKKIEENTNELLLERSLIQDLL